MNETNEKYAAEQTTYGEYSGTTGHSPTPDLEGQRKYRMTDMSKTIRDGEGVAHNLYRIQATTDFTAGSGKNTINVKAGDLGGWIENESCLTNTSPEFSRAWVAHNAAVFAGSRMYGHSLACNNALVEGHCILDQNAVVKDHANLEGYVYVSDNAIIADYAVAGGNAHIKGNSEMNDYSKAYNDAVLNNVVLSGYVVADQNKFYGNNNDQQIHITDDDYTPLSQPESKHTVTENTKTVHEEIENDIGDVPKRSTSPRREENINDEHVVLNEKKLDSLLNGLSKRADDAFQFGKKKGYLTKEELDEKMKELSKDHIHSKNVNIKHTANTTVLCTYQNGSQVLGYVAVHNVKGQKVYSTHIKVDNPSNEKEKYRKITMRNPQNEKVPYLSKTEKDARNTLETCIRSMLVTTVALDITKAKMQDMEQSLAKTMPTSPVPDVMTKDATFPLEKASEINMSEPAISLER